MAIPRVERRFTAFGRLYVPVSRRDATGAAQIVPGTGQPMVELRDSAEEGKLPEIIGYTAVFGVDTQIETWFGPFRERIKKGAFRRAIREGQDVRALRNHDPDNILGRTSARTLKIREDDTGLWIEVDTANTTVGRDTVESIRRGDISGMSFAFIVKQERWIMGDENELDLRIIEDVDLYDVGPVTYPAYTQTSADIRTCSCVYQRGLAELGREVPPLPEEAAEPAPVPPGPDAASAQAVVEESAPTEVEPSTPVKVLNDSLDEEQPMRAAEPVPVQVAAYRRRLAENQSAALRNSVLTKLLTK